MQEGLGLVQSGGQAEPHEVKVCPCTGQVAIGHRSRVTQELVVTSMTVSSGHSQRTIQFFEQEGLGMVQFGGQAEPQKVKTWPSTGQAASGHSSTVTQVLLIVSMTVPFGHSHRAIHRLIQEGLGLVQLAGQAEPHVVKIWPCTGQGHSYGLTQELESTSTTVPSGHSQRGTHRLIQEGGLRLLQLIGQGEPQAVKTCPLTGQGEPMHSVTLTQELEVTSTTVPFGHSQ